MAHTITDRQRDVLQCIDDAIAADGIPPTIREIGNRMGIHYAGVHQHITALQRKGYIRRTRTGRARGLIRTYPDGAKVNAKNSAVAMHAEGPPAPSLREILPPGTDVVWKCSDCGRRVLAAGHPRPICVHGAILADFHVKADPDAGSS